MHPHEVAGDGGADQGERRDGDAQARRGHRAARARVERGGERLAGQRRRARSPWPARRRGAGRTRACGPRPPRAAASFGLGEHLRRLRRPRSSKRPLDVEARGGLADPAQEVVRRVAGVLGALRAVEAVGERPQPVLSRGGGGHRAGTDGVLAEEGEDVQLEPQPAAAHVAVDDRGQHVARIGGAERALEVGELGQDGGRIGRAERDPVLGECRRTRGSAAGAAAVSPCCRACARARRRRHDRRRRGRGRPGRRPDKGAPAGGAVAVRGLGGDARLARVGLPECARAHDTAGGSSVI